MGKKAMLLIQLFAEDVEPETSNEVEDETVDTTEETETEPIEETEKEETIEEPEKVKTFTQDEVDEMIKSRIKRERNKVAKDYESELSKYKELEYLTSQGLKVNSLDEVVNKTRDFYGKQGIKYTPARSEREESILAEADTSEILDNCDTTEDIEAEVDRFIKKGVNITSREKAILNNLVGELETRKRVEDLKKLGVKSEVYDSSEFKAFEKKFAKDTPIADIYNMYRSTMKSARNVENPGSMKTTPGKVKKDYITEAEYDKMSDKEIEENMDLIHRSMSKW